MKTVLQSVRMLLVLTLLTGVVYPLAVTVVARVAFPSQAAGSLLVRDGRAVGSALIGQPFTAPEYFWSRPSATAPPYDGGASAGSNLGPLRAELVDAVRARIAALRAADPSLRGPIPVDLVSISASGLDPDISVAAALAQAPRVARARGVSEAWVRELVAHHTRPRTWGLLGEPTVAVLPLNLALDTRSRRAS